MNEVEANNSTHPAKHSARHVKHSCTRFFPHLNMTHAEHSVWEYAITVTAKTKCLTSGYRQLAARFEDSSKDKISRAIKGLVAKGWFEKTIPSGKDARNMTTSASYRPLSADEYRAKYPEVCRAAVARVLAELEAIEQERLEQERQNVADEAGARTLVVGQPEFKGADAAALESSEVEPPAPLPVEPLPVEKENELDSMLEELL